MIDVLEHLFRPREIVQRCHDLLKVGGVILIKVPNYKMQLRKQAIANIFGISKLGIFEPFAHINQYSPKALDILMKDIGMEPVECIVGLSENRHNAPIKNFFRKFVFYFFEIFRKLTGINLGLNIYYIARKS